VLLPVASEKNNGKMNGSAILLQFKPYEFLYIMNYKISSLFSFSWPCPIYVLFLRDFLGRERNQMIFPTSFMMFFNASTTCISLINIPSYA
jgi:hypothetical protein